MCSLWTTSVLPAWKAEVLNLYTKFFKEEFLTDLTLLVGPDQVPIKVHRVILAAHFEYFRSMFSVGLKESTSTVVRLPFVGPEDLRLILNCGYSEEADLTKENVLKMAVMAIYFGCNNLLDMCCTFIRQFINLKNCVQLLEAAVQMDIHQLRKDCFLFILDHLPEVNKDSLSALPVELLLEIIQHPAAEMCSDFSESEKRLCHLIWDKIIPFPEEQKTELTVKALKAIHLPKTDKQFHSLLLKEVEHITEARDLIMKAGEDVEVSETREWYLSRYVGGVQLKLYKCGEPTELSGLKCTKPIEVNGITTDEYSKCVLINGFPFFVYVTSPNQNETEYHVESPVAIEHLGLRYKVFVYLTVDKESGLANIYQNGVVDRFPVRKSSKRDWVGIDVRLQ